MSQFQNFYPVFEGNQVLTSTQLNQLVAYLDEQNRITRAKLIGMGIVCGLEIKPGTTVPLTFHITKGMGITSQGYLISQCDAEVDRYKTYELPDGVNYAPFQDPQTKEQDVTLYELVTTDYQPVPGETLLPLSSPSGFLNDKVVLLFIEISDTDLKSCLGMSCDEKGKVREFVIRKLLISKADMEQKVFPRTCQQTSLNLGQYELPEVILQRPLFDAALPNSKDYFRFSENYVNAIRGTQFVSPFTTTSNNLYNKLFDALRQTYVDFAAILSPVYGGVNPFAGFPDATWTAFLNGSSAGPRYLGMQYFYDFIQDLILAYNEFRDTAFNLVSECCMNMDCFPQHLMLGEAIPVVSNKPSRYRHLFQMSPAQSSQKGLLQQCLDLFARMVLMVRKFNLGLVNNPSITIVPPSTLAQPVIITPSKEKQTSLSERSIPYYYKINEPDAQLGTLEKVWSYEYVRKYLFSKGLEPLGYGNQVATQEINQGPVKTPLYYDIDPYNFLRIEGGIRQSWVPVKNRIEELKNRFDLAFNVVTLRLAGNPLDDIDERCDFNDIRTEYGTLRTEITGLLQEIFNRFGTVSEGHVTNKPWPVFLKTLINDTNSGGLKGSVTQPLTGFKMEKFSSGLIPITIPVPVYAPERTMSQATEYVNASLVQMLLSINDILTTNKLPFNITDFNFGYTGVQPNPIPGFIQTYLNALQQAINVKVGLVQIFDLVMRSSRIRNTANLYFDLANYIQETMGVLEKFITSNSYKSLMLLNYTYQYRFQYLKTHDQTLFSNFIQKHPGIRHGAGVPMGGTYILVVPGNAVTVDPIKRSYMVAETRDIKATEVQLAKYEAKEYKSVEDEENIKMLHARVANYVQVKDELAIGIPVQKVAIQPYQVIADFWLPYACCCDCECDIPHVTSATQLNMPAIAQPLYVEYNLGDYAFGHDMFVKHGTDGNIEIKVTDALQYQKSIYDPSQIRLYLVNKGGVRMNYTVISREGAEFVDVSTMSTYNTPNDPANTTLCGTVKIRIYDDGQAPAFIYRPASSAGAVYRGIDSFYYMFEILDDTGKVVSRSDMAVVNINVMDAIH